MLALLSLGLAAAPDAQIVAAVSALYGKEVPAEGVCIERFDLAEPFGEVAAVGTRRGARGCGMVGVMVGDELVDAKRSASRAADLAGLAAKDRATALATWTEKVLLAFEIVDDPAKAEVKGSGAEVRVTFWRHGDEAEVAIHTTVTFSYDAAGVLTGQEADKGEAFDLDFIGHKDQLQGIDEATAKAAIDTKGSSLAKCFWKAFAADPSMEGPVKLRWTVAGGKASQITYVAQSRDPRMGGLAQCYATHLEATTWPDTATGTVSWVFAGVRGAL